MVVPSRGKPPPPRWATPAEAAARLGQRTPDNVGEPQLAVTDRAMVRRLETQTLRVESDFGIADFMLWADGSADVSFARWVWPAVRDEHVELESAEEFGPLLDRILEQVIRRR